MYILYFVDTAVKEYSGCFGSFFSQFKFQNISIFYLGDGSNPVKTFLVWIFLIEVYIPNELLWPVLFNNIFPQEMSEEENGEKSARREYDKKWVGHVWRAELVPAEAFVQQGGASGGEAQLVVTRTFAKTWLFRTHPPRQCFIPCWWSSSSLYYFPIRFWLWCPEVFSCKRGVLGALAPNLCPASV